MLRGGRLVQCEGTTMEEGASERRDMLLVIAVVVAVLALIAGLVGVGLASRAVGEHNHTATATATPAAATATADGASAAATIDIRLSEFHVGLPTTAFTPGVKTLHITNAGSVQHELLVFRSDLAPANYPLDHGDINEDGPGITKVSDGDNLDPGRTQTRTVDLSTPGTYLFVCNLPGHFHSGMYTVATVGATPETVSVALSEFKIGVGATVLPRGTATLAITNGGTVPHELLVFRTALSPSAFPVDPDGTIQEDASGMNKISDGDNLDPGKGQTRLVDLSRPGTYTLVCNLPGHFRAGMYTTITVK